MRFFLIIFLSCTTLFGQIIPRDVLFSNPDKTNCTISPCGKYIAYLAPYESVLNVWVKTIGKEDDRPVTKVKERPILYYMWTFKDQTLVYGNDCQGDENVQLFLVDCKVNKTLPITEKGAVSAIVHTSNVHPNEMLICSNIRESSVFDIYKISLDTLDKKLVFENKEDFSSFVANDDLQLQVLMKQDENGGLDFYFKKDKGFEKAWHYDVEEGDCQIVSITSDKKTLYYLDAKGSDLISLKAYDFASKKSTTLFSPQKADIQGITTNSQTKVPTGCLVNHLKPELHILDIKLKEDLEKIKTYQGDMEINYISSDHLGKNWVICFYKDDGPSEYWHYDRVNKKGSFLFSNNERLENYQLTKMEPMVIKSRDGLDLVSYLSRPKEQKNPGSMILLVHGGPWTRDQWEYNSMHQWLANRGYAVLSVNFRGSTGFGKAFLNAGDRQWSKKMHDDLIDAVNFAIDKKIADPDKIAIMGGSYGGYATLVGLTFTPDIFALGVDIVGPSHVKTLIETIPPYWKPMLGLFNARIGDLKDEAFLDEISPLTKIENIKKPLLILQGKNDPRVKEAESEQIVNALTDKNIPVSYVLFPDEGHGFRIPENRIASIAVIEKFLAKHLGGEFEEIKDAVDSSSAQFVTGKEHVFSESNHTVKN